MDFSRLLKGAMPLLAGNSTSFNAWSTNAGSQYGRNGLLGSIAPLLGGQLNPLLRVFMLVYELLGSQLGLDPTLVLTFVGICWAVNRVYAQLYRYAAGLVTTYLMANVHVSGSDEMYLHLMKWLALQPAMVNSRSLSAETVSKTAWEGEEESDVLATRISADGSGVYLDFSGQEAKAVCSLPNLVVVPLQMRA
jgi:mitochondrial chaperone BCS1